ncbi:ankyrin repeat domain-containing protein [Acidobacteriota bacterium]
MKRIIFSILIVSSLAFTQSVQGNDSEFIEAAKNGNSDLVKKMLDLNPELINSVDGGLRASALHWALIYGKKNVVKVLLSFDPDVNQEEAHQGTTLHWAAHYDDAETMAWLLVRGGKIDHVNQYGRTPLLVAARRGCTKVIEILLEKGTDIEAKLRDGSTALHIAAQNGHTRTIDVLIDKGLDPDIKNDSGSTYREVLFSRPETIERDTSAYSRFAGLYEYPGSMDMDIRLEDNRLYYYAYGKDELFPIGEDRFITSAEVKYFTFITDDTGVVSEVVFRLGSRVARAKKIK